MDTNSDRLQRVEISNSGARKPDKGEANKLLQLEDSSTDMAEYADMVGASISDIQLSEERTNVSRDGPKHSGDASVVLVSPNVKDQMCCSMSGFGDDKAASIDTEDGVLQDMTSSVMSNVESLAPDGGYVWVVVVASFYVAFLFGLFMDGFSVLYVEIEDYFSSSKAYTGWIGSLSFSTGRLLGG